MDVLLGLLALLHAPAHDSSTAGVLGFEVYDCIKG